MSDETDTVGDYGLLDTRYALYFAPPPGSPLKQLADAWLGRDPDIDERVPQHFKDNLRQAKAGK